MNTALRTYELTATDAPTDALTAPASLPGAVVGPHPGALAWVQLGCEHALLVARGAPGPAQLDELRCCLGSGVRYLVCDLSALTACPPALLSVLDDAARVLAARHGWLLSVATPGCVRAALDTALDDTALDDALDEPLDDTPSTDLFAPQPAGTGPDPARDGPR
jgi:hypothetical protein